MGKIFSLETRKEFLWWINNLKKSNGKSLGNVIYSCNIECLTERLRSPLLGLQNRGTTVKSRKKSSYKHSAIESNKFCNNKFYKKVSKSKTSLTANGKCNDTFSHYKIQKGFRAKSFQTQSQKLGIIFQQMESRLLQVPVTLSLEADHYSWSVTASSKY